MTPLFQTLKVIQITLNKISKGFTLIEILIAITLLGIMMVLLFGSLRIGAKNWDAGEEKIVETSQITIVQNFLRTYLASAIPADDFNEDEPVFSFVGSGDSIQFASTLPPYGVRKGQHLFKLFLKDEGDTTSLNVSVQTFYPLEEEEVKDDIVLLENIEKLEINYFGPDEFGEGTQWDTKWEEKRVLPRLIQIDIQLKDKPPWPALRVATRIEALGLLPR